MFKLTISTSNAAFEEDARAEIARILRDTASSLERQHSSFGQIRDVNGNRVGTFEYSPE